MSCAKDEGGDGDEFIQRLLRLQKVVLGRIIDTAHLAADAQNVHREKHGIDTDEAHPEMDFSERHIHGPPEYFGEPIVDAAKCCKERSDGHHEMEMSHDEVRILKLDVGG